MLVLVLSVSVGVGYSPSYLSSSPSLSSGDNASGTTSMQGFSLTPSSGRKHPLVLNYVSNHAYPESFSGREFFAAGVFRLLAELAKIAAPMVLRELILFVEGKAAAVPNNVAGGLALAVFLLLVVLLQACALQHFIHGGTDHLAVAVSACSLS